MQFLSIGTIFRLFICLPTPEVHRVFVHLFICLYSSSNAKSRKPIDSTGELAKAEGIKVSPLRVCNSFGHLEIFEKFRNVRFNLVTFLFDDLFCLIDFHCRQIHRILEGDQILQFDSLRFKGFYRFIRLHVFS